MKQQFVILQVQAAILNEGEKDARVVNYPIDPLALPPSVRAQILTLALPEVHDGQGNFLKQ